MKLAGASADELSRTKTAYDTFLADPERLAAVRKQLAAEGLTPDQRHVLEIMEKTFKVGSRWAAGGGGSDWARVTTQAAAGSLCCCQRCID